MIKSLRFLLNLTPFIAGSAPPDFSQNIHNIFDLVRTANRYGAPINHIFKKIVDQKLNYWDFRRKLTTFLLTSQKTLSKF